MYNRAETGCLNGQNSCQNKHQPQKAVLMTREYFKLWQHSLTLMTQAPWVMNQRLNMFAQPQWNAATCREYNKMFQEKADAINESWLAWHKAMWKMQPLAMMWTGTDWSQYQQAWLGSMKAANQAMTPLSRRVRANHNRLSRRK